MGPRNCLRPKFDGLGLTAGSQFYLLVGSSFKHSA